SARMGRGNDRRHRCDEVIVPPPFMVPKMPPKALGLFHPHKLGTSVIDSIEQELERSVWLPAKRDLGSKQKQPSSSNIRFSYSDAVLKIPLAPRPSASERFITVEPCYRFDVFTRRRSQAKHRAVVEEHVEPLVNPICER